MDDEGGIAAFSGVLDSKDGCFVRAPPALIGQPLAHRLSFLLTELQVCHDDHHAGEEDRPSGWKDVKACATLFVLQEVGGKTRGRLSLGKVEKILAFLEVCVRGKIGGLLLEWEHRPVEGAGQGRGRFREGP